MDSSKCVLALYLLAFVGWPVSSRVLLRSGNSLPQCKFNEPLEVGRIQDPELVEASGMVASRKHPGVYYSIQDSQNPDNVYAFSENGESIGNHNTPIFHH